MQAKIPQEFLGCPKKQRTPGRIQPSQLLDQIVLHQLIHCMVAFDATDFLNLQLRDRLLVGIGSGKSR